MSQDHSDITLAILAGGAGSRMGKPKSLLNVNGIPILEYLPKRFDWPGPTMLVTAPGREHPPGHQCFTSEAVDEIGGEGPLRGVLTALDHATTSHALVAVVDMPIVSKHELEELLGNTLPAGAVIGRFPARRFDKTRQIEPFPCIFHRDARDPIRARLQAQERSVRALGALDSIQVIDVQWESDVWLNLNHPSDLIDMARLGTALDLTAPRLTRAPVGPMVALAIPGLWSDRGALARRILSMSSGQFIFFGGDLIRTSDVKVFQCDVIEHDPELVESFRTAARGRIDDDVLEEIARHTLTVYVRGEAGSIDAARDLMDAATALVAAGGLAVKIESAGLAHSSVEWLQRADPTQPAGLYWTYVALIRAEGDLSFSRGMHTFGLRDAVTEIVWEREMLASLMHNFLGLCFSGTRELCDGDQFEDPSGIKYRIRAEPCTTAPPGTIQHNPYGMWRLELVDE